MRRARRASLPLAVLLAVAASVALLTPAGSAAAPPAAGCDAGTPVGPTKTTYKCNIPTGTIGGYEVRQ
jgi:hypothetical protein